MRLILRLRCSLRLPMRAYHIPCAPCSCPVFSLAPAPAPAPALCDAGTSNLIPVPTLGLRLGLRPNLRLGMGMGMGVRLGLRLGLPLGMRLGLGVRLGTRAPRAAVERNRGVAATTICSKVRARGRLRRAGPELARSVTGDSLGKTY